MKTTDTGLIFPDAFFEDEVRNGFFVPGLMKRYWAEELEILHTVAQICERHSIPWFAGEGTLLGAVRHHGFIPWDDDIDIYIMRDDAKRFLDALNAGLPEAFTVRTTADAPYYLNSLIRIGNGTHLHGTLEDLEQHHGCPYTAGIDVFLLDGIFRDEEKENERMKRIADLRRAVQLAEEGNTENREYRVLLTKIAAENRISFRGSKDVFRELRLLKERVYGSCPVAEAEEIIMFWEPGNRTARFRKEWFSACGEMPFETTVIRVPKEYDAVLRTVYGSYEQEIRTGGGHGYPCYRNQQEDYERSAGHRPLTYNFSEADATGTRPVTKRAQVKETIRTMDVLRDKVQTLESAGNEALAGQLRAGLEQAEAALEAQSGGRNWHNNKREILFLPVRAGWWQAMEDAWRLAKADDNNDVYVMVLPWYEKHLDGTTGTLHDEHDDFPRQVRTITSEEYNVAARCPDIIVTQFPFDGFSLYMTVPPFFYTENLRAHTDRLIYIPCFQADTPGAGEEKARISLQYLIEQPAVMFADEVLVPTEGMRELYVDHLCRLGGETHRKLWEQKIRYGDGWDYPDGSLSIGEKSSDHG